MRRLPGFISASIHRGLDGTRVANYAHWRSSDAFEAMLANREARADMEVAIRLAAAQPVLYEVAGRRWRRSWTTQRLGLAERRPDPASRRGYRVGLTSPGREQLSALVAEARQADLDLTAGLPAGETEQLKKPLRARHAAAAILTGTGTAARKTDEISDAVEARRGRPGSARTDDRAHRPPRPTSPVRS